MNDKSNEITVYGLQSVNALCESSPDKIKRLFYNASVSKKFGKITAYLASKQKIYRQVTDGELEKITGTNRHSGVAAVIDPPLIHIIDDTSLQKISRDNSPLIILDRVGNPNNLGAIVRTAAFFGLKNIVLTGNDSTAMISSASYRTAQGGMEFVKLYRAADPAGLINMCKQYFTVIGTTLNSQTPLDALSSKIPPGKPVAFIFGNEEDGLDIATEKLCDLLTIINGSGKMDSLNVSNAASIVMYELKKWRSV